MVVSPDRVKSFNADFLYFMLSNLALDVKDVGPNHDTFFLGGFGPGAAKARQSDKSMRTAYETGKPLRHDNLAEVVPSS